MPRRHLQDPENHTHPHHGLHPIKLHLTHAQILKAKNGHPIQIKHEHIGHGHIIHIHPETYKKLHTAHSKGTGSRVYLTHHELHGAGFLDVIKKFASPVLSGLAGVASELLPQYKGTIGKVREGIRTATGYGLKPRKQMHHGNAMNSEHNGFMHGDGMHHSHMHGRGGMNSGPQHFVGGDSDHYGFGIKKKHVKHKKHVGFGINPSGYGY